MGETPYAHIGREREGAKERKEGNGKGQGNGSENEVLES